MITRFYVDNYKCLVNFEYKPKPMELIVGGNGSGKTTVFEALGALQDFIVNQRKVDEVFATGDLTRWQGRERIIFSLEISGLGKSYQYELVLEIFGFMSFVFSETLKVNGKDSIKAHFKSQADDEESGISAMSFLEVTLNGATVPSAFRIPDGEKSAVGKFNEDFISLLKDVFLVKLNPQAMQSTLRKTEKHPVKSFVEFPGYYFYLLQEKQNLIFDLIPMLRENVDGFRSFTLAEHPTHSSARQLRVDFAVAGGKKGQTVTYDFTELSDGQRALIALYTLAFCESGSTLLIDEPENFISSRELQPWLMLLRERIEDFGGQAILISHHPEFINVLAPQDAIQFRRKDGGPVMIRPFETAPYQGLTPAEIVARGWENE